MENIFNWKEYGTEIIFGSGSIGRSERREGQRQYFESIRKARKKRETTADQANTENIENRVNPTA